MTASKETPTAGVGPELPRKAVLLFLALAVVVVASAAEPADEGWRTIANESFSFSIPPGFEKTDARGIDSFVEEYVRDGITLDFDYGLFSNDFTGWPDDTTYERVQVDGESARIGTARGSFGRPNTHFLTQIYFKIGNGHANLSMSAACRSEEDVELAKKIFRSIRFVRQPDGGSP